MRDFHSEFSKVVEDSLVLGIGIGQMTKEGLKRIDPLSEEGNNIIQENHEKLFNISVHKNKKR